MPGQKSDQRSIDMQQLADLAGVSRATVSRALNDSPLVNARTRERITRLAEEHRFMMNETARNLRLRRSNMICLVLMHDVEVSQHLSDPFFLRMVGAIVDNLADCGHDLVLYHKPADSAAEVLASRAYRQCDGVIFVGQGTLHDELNKLAGYQKPIIVWGADLPGRTYPIVGTDNVMGGKQVTRHLLSQGCRRIAFFGDTGKPELALRHTGYAMALDRAGLAPDRRLELSPPMEKGAADSLINEFIESDPEIDGIVCCSDLLAASAISCLQRHGISVPAQVAVTGYDDLQIGARIHPTLTTVSQDIPRGGKQLVKKMMGLLAGKNVRGSMQDPTLIIRESSVRRIRPSGNTDIDPD